MSDNDLIRRGDAKAVATQYTHTMDDPRMEAEMDAIPAVAASHPEGEGAAHIVEYTNWRGETARRVIRPIRMWWGKTEYHPEDQWMLTAYDCEKEATRDFAWQDMRPIPNPATSVVASQPADPVTNADSRQRVLDKNGDLVGSKLEMKLRSDWRKISKHHGLAHNGVLEADIVRAFLAAIDVQPDPRDAQPDEATTFDRADWYWRTMDPDDCGVSPAEAVNRGMVGQFCVCEVASSYEGPTRYGFIAPVLDLESDDEEFLHFASQQEAIDAASERRAAIAAVKGGAA